MAYQKLDQTMAQTSPDQPRPVNQKKKKKKSRVE
jgi:hypothetical protein